MLPKFKIDENAKYHVGIFMLSMSEITPRRRMENVVLFKCYRCLTNNVQYILAYEFFVLGLI